MSPPGTMRASYLSCRSWIRPPAGSHFYTYRARVQGLEGCIRQDLDAPRAHNQCRAGPHRPVWRSAALNVRRRAFDACTNERVVSDSTACVSPSRVSIGRAPHNSISSVPSAINMSAFLDILKDLWSWLSERQRNCDKFTANALPDPRQVKQAAPFRIGNEWQSRVYMSCIKETLERMKYAV